MAVFGMPWLVIWKNPMVEEARRIWSTTIERVLERSMMGSDNLAFRVKDFGLGEFWGGWWKMRGMVVRPESTRPFTPSVVVLGWVGTGNGRHCYGHSLCDSDDGWGKRNVWVLRGTQRDKMRFVFIVGESLTTEIPIT
ncbi:unnamed protein product [Ilex paraguariensis]|uniref:Uncharacterized protein n=1 Tax=Ilex paraguariensis TaxID=185542 RepID=A0ABC8USZ3_9AQUA